MQVGALTRGLPMLAGVAMTIVVCAACGSAPTTGQASAVGATHLPTGPPVAPISWTPCPSSASLECGSVAVPLDYSRRGGPSIDVAVTRAPALDPTDSRGTLLFNPGGPGESGNQLLPVALSLLPAPVRRSYDIVSFDPRGTGASDPLRCGTRPDALTSVLPVPAGSGRPLPGTAAFTAMARACAREVPALTASVDTVDTARDMDRIRRALGLATVSYYGLSYGTVLGAVYADLFPTHVAQMVLDGAVDVDATLTTQASEEAPAAEASMHHLLATCGGQSPCPLGADPFATYRSLVTSLAAHPLPAPAGDTAPVTVGDLEAASLFAVTVPDFTTTYLTALVAAEAGDGAPLRALARSFATDLDGQPLVDALWAITCNDAAVHPGPLVAGALARSIDAHDPLLGAYAVTYTMGGCVAWPRGHQPVVDLHPGHAPPVLVIGNTGDPNTPHIAAVHLAAIFPRGRLLTWTGWGHTWLLSGATDPCMRQAVSTYLTRGGLPAPDATCP